MNETETTNRLPHRIPHAELAADVLQIAQIARETESIGDAGTALANALDLWDLSTDDVDDGIGFVARVIDDVVTLDGWAIRRGRVSTPHDPCCGWQLTLREAIAIAELLAHARGADADTVREAVRIALDDGATLWTPAERATRARAL